MSQSPFSRLRESLSQSGQARNKYARPSSRRNLAFESLERRELLAVSSLADFSVSSDTGEKPQSKVWEYNDQWYAVMPDKDGTWVWKLNGSQWQHELQLSTNDSVNADVKVVGDLAHVLLFEGTQSHLATIQYDNGSDNRYEMWSLRPSLVNVSLSSGVETATLEVDTTGRMWIASDASTTMEVRYADLGSQYTNWSAPITVASGTKSDDISTIIAMPNGSIGLMWSNQNTKRFGFRLHVDGTTPTIWTNDELPASQSAQSKGAGMADDHMHLAVASNGTLYAAVKTSYDSSGYPKIALLVRRASGVWDNLYQVDTSGTRPIVMLNEAAGKLIIAYTSSENGGDIYYKETSMNTISFGDRQTLISGSVNNVSSIKGNFTDEVVAIAGSGSKAKGSMFRFDGPIILPPPPQNQAPNVNAGTDQTIQLAAGAALNGTVTDDGRPTGGSLTTSWTQVSGPGTVTFANAAAIDTNATFSIAGTYVLRLTANDSSLQTTDTVTIVVQGPVTAPVNQAPSVNAGADQTIQLSAAASLSGVVTDDGLPSSPGSVTRTWTRISGPGTVTFGNASSASTTASFSVAGTYVLRLTANDGSLQSFDEVSITVQAAAPANQSPVVTMSSTLTVQLPASANLTATVSDVGGPLATPLLSWTRVSGPGTVTFGNASSANSTATFSTAGTYVLRLTANDGQLQSYAEITVTVVAAPAPAPTQTQAEKLLAARKKLRG